jgi:hypothetical protein
VLGESSPLVAGDKLSAELVEVTCEKILAPAELAVEEEELDEVDEEELDRDRLPIQAKRVGRS